MGENYLLFIQSLAKSELYNLLVQSNKLDGLFPCLYGNVTCLRHLDLSSFCPGSSVFLVSYNRQKNSESNIWAPQKKTMYIVVRH